MFDGVMSDTAAAIGLTETYFKVLVKDKSSIILCSLNELKPSQ